MPPPIRDGSYESFYASDRYRPAPLVESNVGFLNGREKERQLVQKEQIMDKHALQIDLRRTSDPSHSFSSLHNHARQHDCITTCDPFGVPLKFDLLPRRLKAVSDYTTVCAT